MTIIVAVLKVQFDLVIQVKILKILTPVFDSRRGSEQVQPRHACIKQSGGTSLHLFSNSRRVSVGRVSF